MEPDASPDEERFDPRISPRADEPAVEPSLIPVIRPSAATAVQDVVPGRAGGSVPGRAGGSVPGHAEGSVPASVPVVHAPGRDASGSPEGAAPAASDAPDPDTAALLVPAPDAPITEPPLSEPVPTSVLASAEGDGPGEVALEEVVPDVSAPDPLLEHGPAAAPPRAHRRGRRRQHHRAVFEETLPTQALVMVDRLQSSPYGKRMRSTLQHRRDQDRESLEARMTLDFALKLGETMFSYGASSLDVETSIIVVTQAYGIHETEVDLTNQALSLNYAPDSSRGEVPYTLQRVVRSYSTNFQGLAEVHRLVEQISDGAIERGEAQRRLVEIRRRPRLYSALAEILCAGLLVACFVPLIGGTWTGAAVGMVSTWFVFWLTYHVLAARVPEIFATAAGAFSATMIAFGAHAVHLPVNPAIVVAGGIMMLLPTSRFVTAVQDAINGFPVTAAGRLISAMLVFIGIMAGIMVGVTVGDAVGFARVDLAAKEYATYPAWVLLVLVGVATACDTVMERAHWRLILACTGVAGAAFLVHSAVAGAGLSGQLTPAVAAMTVGFLARVVALRLGAPPLVVVLPSLLFLLPGLMIFRALYEFTVESSTTLGGVAGIFNALVIIVGIAAGAVLGDTLARPLTDRLTATSTTGPLPTPGVEGHQR